MSKKRFILFALVAALVLGFAGMASAASANLTWNTALPVGDIGTSGNWTGVDPAAAPTGIDLITIGGSDTTINVTGPYTVGAIQVNATGTVTFNIAAGAVLTINGDTTLATAPSGVYGIRAIQGNVIFQGEGTVRLSGTAAVVNYRIYAAEASAVTFKTAVQTLGAGLTVTTLRKYEKGTLAFAADKDNEINAVTTGLVIHDGVVELGRPEHLADRTVITLGDAPDPSTNNPTLATTWTSPSGGRAFANLATAATPKISVVRDGTIKVGGTPLVLGAAAYVATADGILNIAANTELTKTGTGTIITRNTAASTTAEYVIEAAADSLLTIAEGGVTVGANHGIIDTLDVDVADGAKFTVARGFTDAIGALGGDEGGTVAIEESGTLSVTNGTDYPGYVTGFGNLTLRGAGNVTLSGIHNDYTGDTTVGADTTLILSKAENIGPGRLFLTATGVTNVAAFTATPSGAAIRVAKDSSFVLQNLVAITPANTGRVTVDVPDDFSFEFEGNIDYDGNFITKVGTGNLILNNIGYDAIGGGRWNVEPAVNAPITVALQILNGRARIDNGTATHFGDIVLGPGGGGTGVLPILSVRNGVVLDSAILFNNFSTFETEIVPANFRGGSSVTPAVDVGALVTTATVNDSVYNRINFLSLPSGTVKSGDVVQLLKGRPIDAYAASNVFPIEQNGVSKAPFDPFISTNFLYFEATKDIDVPVFGAASQTSVEPGGKINITIPVETATSLRADTLNVVGLKEAGATGVAAIVSGKSVVISGVAPELAASADQLGINYSVSVTSASAGNDVIGYGSRQDFTLTVRAGDTPDPTVDAPYYGWVWDGPASPVATADATEFRATLSLNDVHTLPASTTPVALTSVQVKLSLGAAEVETKTFGEPADGKIAVSFTPAAGATFAAGTYTLEVVGGVTPPAGYTQSGQSKTVTVTASDSGRTGSGGGCDAGFGLFGLFGLLAATGAVTLLRRKG